MIQDKQATEEDLSNDKKRNTDEQDEAMTEEGCN